MHYEPTGKMLDYTGESFSLVVIVADSGFHPAPEPGDPVYDLVDASGTHRYTLWWAHGLPEMQYGRVFTIEDAQTHQFKRGELMVEMTTGWHYVDNRRLATKPADEREEAEG